MKRNLVLTLMFVVTIVAVSCGFQAPTYIPNGSGADVRNAINNALKSVMSQHSAPTEPSNAQPFMYWVDTSTTPPTTRQRNATNTAWDVLPTFFPLNTVNNMSAGKLNYTLTTLGGYPKATFNVEGGAMTLSSEADVNTINSLNFDPGGDVSLYARGGSVTSTAYTNINQQAYVYINPNGSITLRALGGALYVLPSAAAPSTASSTCIAGEMRWDTNYEYRCVATNTWKRIPMSTW